MNSQTEDTNAVKKKLFKKDDYRAFRIALDVQESDLEDFCIEMSKKKVKSPKCLLKSVFKEKNSQVEKKSSQKAEKKIDHSLTVRTEKENIKPKKNVINQPLEEIFNDEEEIIEASGEQKEIEEKKKEKKKKALNVDLDVVKKKKIFKKTKKNSKNVSKEATLDVMNTTFLEENEEITNEEIANEEITDDEITKNVTKKKENVTKKKKTKGIVKSKTSEHVSTEKKKISRKSKKIPKNLQDDSNMETNEAFSFEGIENYKETDNANEEVSINIKNPNSSSVALIEEGQDLQSFEEICKNIQNSSTFIEEDEGEKLGEIEEEKREAEEEVEKAEIEVEQEDIEKEEKDEEIEVEQEVIEDEEEENEVEQENIDDKETEKVEKEKQVEQEELEEKSDDETEKEEEEEEEEAEEEIEERLSAQNEETLKIQNEDRTENETLHLPSISLEMSEPSENSEVTLNLAEKCSTPKVNQAIASTSSFSPLKEKEENYKLNEISEALAKVHISPQPTEKVKVSKREAARKRKEQRDQKKMAKAVGKINNYALKQLKKLDVDVVHPELQQYINSVQADTESSSSSDEETSDVCYCPDCDCSLLCECSCCNDSSGSSASEYSETCSCSRCQESTSSSSDSCYPVDDSSSEE